MSERVRGEITMRLRNSAGAIAKKIDPRLVPEGGLPFGFALRGARDGSGIAGVKTGGPNTGADPENQAIIFGACPEISGIILTAMKFDPSVRSAAIIRCTGPVLAQAENLFFELCTFDAAKEPPGISTMDWGVASCCKDGVPDVIATMPALGKDAALRFFGQGPEDVATNILMVSNRVINIEI